MKIKLLLKKFYRNILPKSLKEEIDEIRRELHPEYFYGQYGEDVLLRLYCMKLDYKGFYVDIGAFHPKRNSNTQWFYERGWNGINIDANPISMRLFKKKRRRDKNILSGVSDKNGEMNYYFFGKDSMMNTFNEELYKKLSDEGNKIKEIKKVKVRTINEILEENLPVKTKIDFVNLDIEGFEMKILNTYNFEKYAPDYFLVEDLFYKSDDIDFMCFSETPLYKFMKGKGYIVVAKTRYTIIFKRV